jgi:hypothetical protein
MRTLAPLLLAGCATHAATNDSVLSNSVPGAGEQRGALFVIEPHAVGPITATARANRQAIQDLVGSRYVVKSIDDRGEELHVFLNDELLFYVIPNDDGSLFNVHCTSNKVAISEHPEWIIGAPLTSALPIDTCECWGAHPMCFKTGDHVAIGFVVPCDNLDTPQQRKALVGVPIQRAVWNPRPFGDGNGGAAPSTRGSKSILTPP